MILEKRLSLSVLQFLHLQNGDDDSACVMGRLLGECEITGCLRPGIQAGRERRELDRALSSPEGLGQGRGQVGCRKEEVPGLQLEGQAVCFLEG